MRKVTITLTLTAVPKDEQRSVIQFIILKNVSGSEIHVRMCVMCVVYGVQNVITKSTVNPWAQGFKTGQMSMNDKP